MLALRSFLFNAAFYLNILFWAALFLPSFLLPRKVCIRVIQGWGRASLWLLRVIVGTRIEVRGREKIPPGGLLVASKHQSLWETFALLTLFDDPAFVLKRELMWIPLFGWYAWRGRMLPINRRAGSRALVELNRQGKAMAEAGRQVIIFPEGTRRAPGAEPAYKYGIAHLYGSLGVPCLPVALNSGLFWPRRSFLRRPGTIVIECLDPIPPGADKSLFFPTLQAHIEAASNRLLAEGQAQLGPAASRQEAARAASLR